MKTRTVVCINLIGVVMIVVVAAAFWAGYQQNRQQAILRIMARVDQDSRQRSAKPLLMAPAALHTFVSQLEALNTSACPADFQTAFQNWVQALDGMDKYTIVDAASDVVGVKNGQRPKGTANQDQITAAFWQMRKAALRYGVNISEN